MFGPSPAVLQLTESGATAAMLAVVRDDANMLALLLRHGADVHHRMASTGATAAHIAQVAGASKCMKVLQHLNAAGAHAPLYRPPSMGAVMVEPLKRGSDGREAIRDGDDHRRLRSAGAAGTEEQKQDRSRLDSDVSDLDSVPDADVLSDPDADTHAASGLSIEEGSLQPTAIAVSQDAIDARDYDSLHPFEQQSLDWLVERTGGSFIRALVQSEDSKELEQAQRVSLLDEKKAEAVKATMSAFTASWKCAECGAMTPILRASSSCSRCACDGGT